MPRQVLHVLNSEAWGGLELYSLTLIQKLQNEGLKVLLLCKKESRVHREAQQRNLPTTHNHFVLLKNPHSFSHVHVHRRQDLPWMRICLLYPKLSNVQFIYSLYMMAPPKKDLYHRWIYKRLDAVLTSSSWVREEIQKNFPIDPIKAKLLRYGRDQIQKASAIQVQELKKRLSSSTEKIIFGTACRIDPGKGLRELVLALDDISKNHLNSFELWVIGEPTLLKTRTDGTPEYEPEAEALQKWLIEFQKKYPQVLKLIPFQKDLNTYLSAMDVFILSSHGETYSLAVIDALLLGIPVLGTNSGGTPEQVLNRGLLVEPLNSKAIAQGIEVLLINTELRKSFSQNAKEWATKEHSWAKTLKELLQIYNEKL